MLKKFMLLLPVCASVLPGCVSAPPLSEATGTQHSDIMIRDVVQRVKCELSDAFYYKVEERDFLWLASWTAHADLTLEINDNAGISPSGQYTKFRRSAPNPDAGPGASKVLQFFTLGAGANLSGQAARTETLSFTIALDELKRWRTDLNRMEANLPPEKRTCNFNSEMGVTGNLGLKEWVDSAFFPVVTGDLQAGIHPSQGGMKPSTTQGPKQGQAVPQLKLGAQPTKEDMERDTRAWQTYLSGLQNKTKTANSKTDDATKKIDTADANLKNKLKALSDSNFEPVLAPYLRQRYALYKNIDQIIQSHKNSEEKCAKFKSDVDDTLKDTQDLAAKLKANVPLEELQIPYGDLNTKVQNIMNNDEPRGDYVKMTARCASVLTQIADQATKDADSLPNQVDPPIDAVSHSLQFVVAYGANITPSWTLIQWKGPGLTQNFLSASGTRTHTLNLAIGPRFGGPPVGTDALRLINNQVVRSLGN